MAQAAPAQERNSSGGGSVSYQVEATIERRQRGKPHQGKMLAAIQPHCDDIPIFAGGTVLKLIDEGYQGILITVSNDSMAGTGSSIGDIVLKNENDTQARSPAAWAWRKRVFLNYPNHNLDAWPIVEMRARLVFLFRAYKIDTVLVYDPSGLYERNPDHYVMARAVESAAWMARLALGLPRAFQGGLTSRTVPQEKYYFARGPQLVNRVVDITDFMDRKVEANLANVTQGPAGSAGRRAAPAARRRRQAAPVTGRRLTKRPTAPTPKSSRSTRTASAANNTASHTPSCSTTSPPTNPTSTTT